MHKNELNVNKFKANTDEAIYQISAKRKDESDLESNQSPKYSKNMSSDVESNITPKMSQSKIIDFPQDTSNFV